MTPRPAPIDGDALDHVLAPFGRSRTLPGAVYTSDEVLGWERDHLFDGSWVCVGRSAELAQAGDQRAVRLGREGVLLTRDEAGGLHAFSNVCRHRGHELLPDGAAANARVIKCPYHAWVYGLDGRLRGAPSFADVAGFDREDFPLVPARVEEWAGWVFVNPSGDGPDLDEHLGNLDDLLSPYEPERLVSGATHEYVVEANWKLIHENYHECYHCSNIHPELCKVTPIDRGTDMVPTGAWAGGSMELMDHARTMSLTGESHGVMLRGLDDRRLREVLYIGLVPNLLVSAHPDYVMTHRLEAVSPGATRVECRWLFAPEAVERPGFDPTYAVEFWDITNRQDWTACESVQRGAGNRGFRQGPLSTRESTVYQFLTLVGRAYRDGRLSRPAVAAARLPEGVHSSTP